MPQLAGLRSRDLSGMLRGRIGEDKVDRGLIYLVSLHLYVFYDHEGRMVGHLVDPLVISF